MDHRLRPHTSSAAVPSSSMTSVAHDESSDYTEADSISSAPVTPSPPPTARGYPSRTAGSTDPRTPDRRKDKHSLHPQQGRQHISHQYRRSSLDGLDDKRHSHGLSWTSNTRDSVVDNLLSSLDHFSGGSAIPASGDIASSADFDHERYRAPTSGATFAAWLPSLTHGQAHRPREHIHTSSVSSDSNPYRTTTTSSGPLSSPISIRTITSLPDQYKGSVTPTTARAGGVLQTPTRSPLQELVRQEHNAQTAPFKFPETQYPGKSTTSGKARLLDSPIGVPTRPSDKPDRSIRQSISMDQLLDDPSQWKGSLMDRGRPVRSMFSAYDSSIDAAPEPNVAAGPRKLENPTASGPVYVNQAPRSNTMRRLTGQSDSKTPLKNKIQAPPVPLSVRDQASEFVRASNAFATSPMAGMESRVTVSSSGDPNTLKNTSQTLPRERAGFFKRVFGGGSARFSNNLEKKDARATTRDSRTKSITSSVAPPMSSPAPEIRAKTSDGKYGSAPSPATQRTPSLHKRPSSFFRRRKKSVNLDSDVPPVPTLPTSQDVSSTNTLTRTSSLRRVMDPFLGKETMLTAKSSRASEDDVDVEKRKDSDDLDIFHSGYTPPPLSQGRTSRMAASARSLLEGSRVGSLSAAHHPTRSASTNNYAENNGTDVINQLLNSSVIQRPVSPLAVQVSPQDYTPDPLRVSPISWMKERNDDESTDAEVLIVKQGPTSGVNDRPGSKKSERIYLRPNDSEDDMHIAHKPNQTVTEKFQDSQQLDVRASDQHGAILPSVQLDGQALARWSLEINTVLKSSSTPGHGTEHEQRAQRIFDGIEDDVAKSDAAAWLGERDETSERTLQAYMRLFDFGGMNLLAALRSLCVKLLLKGETQQFDRIIQALSSRWVECNSRHGFKAIDVVHTIFYSLILLNTDLHLADIGEKMSRNAYVRNTIPTIRRVVSDAAPDAFDDTLKPQSQNARPAAPWLDSSIVASPPDTPIIKDTSEEAEKTMFPSPAPNAAVSKRLSLRPSTSRTDSGGLASDISTDMSSSALVSNPFAGSLRNWEVELELVLKSYFNSIKAEPLPLLNLDNGASDRNLAPYLTGGSSLRRSNSVISKAPSENPSFRNRQGFRNMNVWQNRNNRSRQRVYPSSAYGSSRNSLDDDNSLWSPAQSTWSKTSFPRTLTSASMGSLHMTPGLTDYKHSIGFANALSQAIIREEATGASNENENATIPGGLLEDEAMALEGAPWAKEGLVKHKHHLETSDRKARERAWTDCFAVLGKGKLTLFAFNSSNKMNTQNRKPTSKPFGKAASIASTTVGGGDWMENAEQLDVFILRQTLASTLPAPGYSKTRPHVWALSLPSGAVHLFQVGTPEIATEFMTTANYWSARLSKEPLSGGVSNIEYGWSEQVINTALIERPGSVASPPPSIHNMRAHVRSPSSTGGGTTSRTSYQSSLRRSIDSGFGGARARLPGDKIQIAEWRPPNQSLMSSQMSEADQLKGLTAYVRNMEEELSTHNELKHAIELAYSPRHTNYNRSMSNWQRKSEYLLREIIKFQTYVESLTNAQQSRDQFFARKADSDAKRISDNGVSMNDRRPSTAATTTDSSLGM